MFRKAEILENFTIRQLQPYDKFEFFRLLEIALEEDPISIPYGHTMFWSNEIPHYNTSLFLFSHHTFHHTIALGLFSHTQLIALLLFTTFTGNPKLSHKGSIDLLYTHPEYRRFGCATLLFEELLELIRKQYHIENLIACAAYSNVPYRKFLQKFGFQQIGIEPNAIKVSEDLYENCVWYIKLLHNGMFHVEQDTE